MTRVLVLLCAASVAATAPPLTSGGTGDSPGADRAEIDAAVAFRERLGLRSDRAFVAATFGKSAFSKGRWGVPLDSAEKSELDRRTDVQKELGRALRAWDREAASAGAYVDQRAGGRPIFLTTRDPAKAKSAMAKLLPAGANARFVRVERSMDELLALQERVNADLRAGALVALGVRSTAIDARGNAVVVGVATDTQLIRDDLAARYGGAVRVTFEAPSQGGDAGPCVARDDCSPAKAGIEIRSSYNGNTCTTGFMVRVAGSPEPRLLTAGHCVGKSGGTGTSRTWTHDGVSLGWAEHSSWTDGADADVAVLSPADGAVSGARNLMFRGSSSDILSITGWRATNSQIQGELVCRAGAASGLRCGTIALTNRTKDVDGRTVDHQWVVDFDACPGDSGGPYFSGGTAYGLHSDSTVGCEPTKNQAWYSPIGWAFEVLKARGHPVELCTSGGCGAEINVWTARGTLDGATWSPTLVELEDGRILEVGGTSTGPLVGGGNGGFQRPEVFAPVSGTWSDAASPPWAPATCDGQFSVRLGNGNVLVGGGRNVGSGDADACDGAFIFDPDAGSSGSWSTVAAPPVALTFAGAALLGDGRAFVIGGSGDTGATSVAMAYDPQGNDWTSLAPAPAGSLAPLVLGLPNGRVFVSGGYRIADAGAPGYEEVSATHVYNPGTNAWASTTPVGAHGMGGMVLADGRVAVAGGQKLDWNGSQSASFVGSAAIYTPSTGAWKQLPAMRRPRAGFAFVEMRNGLLLAAGGRIEASTDAGAATRTTEAYDAGSNAWHLAPSLLVTHDEPGAAVLSSGAVLVAGGGTTASETYAPGDIIPPTSTAPTMGLRTGASMTSSAMPLRISWTGSDRGGSGVGTYEIARSVDGGAYTTIATKVLGTTYDTTGSSGHRYRFQVRARDWAGNVGPWVAGTSLRVTSLEQTSPKITYSGTWSTDVASVYSAGSIRFASTAGRSATYTFTGRAIAFVSARGPSRGSAKIYIDGVHVATVSLYSSTRTYRYVAFQRSWGSSGKHTIRVVVSGTSGHPRVDLDAFETLSIP